MIFKFFTYDIEQDNMIHINLLQYGSYIIAVNAVTMYITFLFFSEQYSWRYAIIENPLLNRFLILYFVTSILLTIFLYFKHLIRGIKIIKHKKHNLYIVFEHVLFGWFITFLIICFYPITAFILSGGPH